MALVVLVCAGFALRAWHPGSDPPLFLSGSNAEIMDGPWYLAEAADRARGNEVGVPAHYRKPLFTALMTVAFRDGVSLERAHIAVAAASALVIPLAAGAAFTAFGRRAALLTAVLLAVGFVPVGYGRTPLVYGPLASGIAGVLWLHACALRDTGGAASPRERARRSATLAMAWLTLGALAAYLQPAALVVAPALAGGQLVAAERRGRALAGLLVLFGLGGLLLTSADPELFALIWGKATAYFGAAAPLAVLKRWLRAPFASGLWPRSPVIGALGWAGVLVALSRQPGGARDRRAIEITLASALALWLSVFSAFEYTEGGPPPLRYFMPALVPAAILAGGVLARLADGIVLVVPRPLAFVWGVLFAYWGLGPLWTGAWAALVPDAAAAPAWLVELVSFRWLFAASIALGTALAWAAARRRRFVAGLRWSAAILLASMLVDAPLLFMIVARPGWSLRDANRALARLIAPGAVVFGSYAHALTYVAVGVSRRQDVLDPRTPAGLLAPKLRGCTHLATEAWRGPLLEDLYVRVGSPLVLVARLEVRGQALNLYRFGWAEEIGYRLSPAERAPRPPRSIPRRTARRAFSSSPRRRWKLPRILAA